MELVDSSLVYAGKFVGHFMWMISSKEIDRIILSENWSIIQLNHHANLDSIISILVGVKKYLTLGTLWYKRFLELK